MTFLVVVGEVEQMMEPPCYTECVPKVNNFLCCV